MGPKLSGRSEFWQGFAPPSVAGLSQDDAIERRPQDAAKKGETTMPHAKHAAEHHEHAAKHHEHAAEHHREAAAHVADGDHEAGAHHAHLAHAHHRHAEHHASEASKAHIELHHEHAAAAE
jgi:hypothetical protein